MPWFIGTIIGTLFLTVLNYFQRITPFNIWHSFYLLPILYCGNLGYWYGYSKAPKFLLVWFFGTALISLSGFCLSIFVFDKGITLVNGIGVLLILLGAYLLF